MGAGRLAGDPFQYKAVMVVWGQGWQVGGTAMQAVAQWLQRLGWDSCMETPYNWLTDRMGQKLLGGKFRRWRFTPLKAEGVLQWGWTYNARDVRMETEMRAGAGCIWGKLDKARRSAEWEMGIDELNILTPLQWIRWWLGEGAKRGQRVGGGGGIGGGTGSSSSSNSSSSSSSAAVVGGSCKLTVAARIACLDGGSSGSVDAWGIKRVEDEVDGWWARRQAQSQQLLVVGPRSKLFTLVGHGGEGGRDGWWWRSGDGAVSRRRTRRRRRRRQTRRRRSRRRQKIACGDNLRRSSGRRRSRSRKRKRRRSRRRRQRRSPRRRRWKRSRRW